MAITTSEGWNRTTEDLGNSRLALNVIEVGGTRSKITVPDANLSTAPISFETSEIEAFRIGYIYFNFSIPVTQTITITKTTGDPNRDQILEVQVLSGNSSARFVSIIDTEINPVDGEQLKLEVTNIGAPNADVYMTLEVVT